MGGMMGNPFSIPPAPGPMSAPPGGMQMQGNGMSEEAQAPVQAAAEGAGYHNNAPNVGS
jgi:hypothetical protein